MPAFSQICKKTNISLFHDTITFYEKKNGQQKLVDYGYGIGTRLNDCIYSELPHFIQLPDFKKLGNIGFIRSNHVNHKHYHQDAFSRETSHYHIQFSKKIDVKKLSEILDCFIENDVINKEEKNQFLSSFVRIEKQNEITKSTFLTQLQVLANKTAELEKKSEDPTYQSEYLAASSLHASLSAAYNNYIKNKTELTFQDFKSNYKQAITKARPELEKDRNYSELFSNLTDSIGYLSYGCCIGSPSPSLSFFRPKIDLKELESSCNKIAFEF